MKHRILLQSNPLWIKTGLSRNSKNLLSYLWKTEKYELAHLCTQATAANDPRLALTPWKSFGCIPPDQDIINRINGDAVFGRDASYGALAIAGVVEEWKPSIWIGSDDIWSHPLAQYSDAAWYKRVHGIHHTTVDSVPVLDQAYEQAKRSKHYLTWAQFAAKEMKRVGGASMSHVQSIYGMMDAENFSPISESEKNELRKQFNIPTDMLIFLFVGRNQLRKSFPRAIEAFAQFKAANPGIKAALHFHTAFSEKGMGWDLPKLAEYHGLKPNELLCTYVCKACGAWLIAPYQGEDLKCPSCGTNKSLVTANIINGVPEHHMRMIYGFCDASLSCHTSGGMEMTIAQSLLCGKPLAVTNYSCGEDVCIPETSSFITPIRWTPYDEPGTNFIKAASRVGDIEKFMSKVSRSSKRTSQEAGERGRAWAKKTFSVEVIGKQWEDLFASLNPNPDWSSVSITAAVERKDPTYQPPDHLSDNTAWLKDIYWGVLRMRVDDSDSGLQHWQNKLSAGVGREAIIAYFRSVAEQENSKLGVGGPTSSPSTDLSALLDNRPGRKRGLIALKESLGDIALITALFPSFHLQHPDTDLYVAVDPKYAEVLAGNEHVHKVLPFIPALEHEMLMIGCGKGTPYFDVFYYPAVQTQKHLSYLSQPEPAFDLTLPPPGFTTVHMEKRCALGVPTFTA